MIIRKARKLICLSLKGSTPTVDPVVPAETPKPTELTPTVDPVTPTETPKPTEPTTVETAPTETPNPADATPKNRHLQSTGNTTQKY